jgi:hypothetical protein
MDYKKAGEGALAGNFYSLLYNNYNLYTFLYPF